MASVLLLGATTAAMAQDKDELYPHWFVGAQVGAQTTFTNYDATKLITPQFGVQVGRWMAPEFGVRLNVRGFQQKGGIAEGQYGLDKQTYKFKALTGDIDFLFNMSNIIFPNRASQKWNWDLLAGFGANYAWDFDDFNGKVQNWKNPYYHEQVCGTKHSTFNGRLGTIFEYNVSRNLALNLEVDADYKNDLFNLKNNDKCDWQASALIGLTFRLGTKKHVAPVATPVAPTNNYNQAEAEAAAKKAEAEALARAEAAKKAAETAKKAEAPKPVVKADPLKETVFFKINVSDPANDPVLDKVVEWCNKYPGKKITVSGYADKGTGTAQINKRISEKRASRVVDALKNKGVSADRISVSSFGDTVQPYEVNNDNRCTIIIGE